MEINFNEFINESTQPHLMIYRGASYPYNYTVIKGDELYFVSFRKGKPFLVKYQGKINKDVYKPIGSLVRKPSMGLIVNIQNKCTPPSKMNEEFDDNSKDMPSLDRVSFIKSLKEDVEEFLKNYPKDFVVNEVSGKLLTIKTTNQDDLRIVVRFSGDKINFNAKPTEGPEYEFAYNFDKNGVDSIFGLIKSAFENDPNDGMVSTPIPKTQPLPDISEPQDVEIQEEEIDIDTPITKKPKRRVKSININIIQDVLEDAYILNDIDLGNTSIEELLRRMLVETRRKSKK